MHIRVSVFDRYKNVFLRFLFTARFYVLTFLHLAWLVDDAKCILVTRVCVSVCLSVRRRVPTLVLLHGPECVTWRNGRRCRLVMHYWVDLQSVHGFCCYDNTASNAKCHRVLCTRSVPGFIFETFLFLKHWKMAYTLYNQAQIEQRALAGISRSALWCHSNETRAPIANPPISGQLEGIPYHFPSYIRVRSLVWKCDEG